MIYNMDFLISAMVILLLILWHFLGQKRAEDLNNRVFLFFAVLGTADVVAEFFTNYYITSYNSDMENAAVIVTMIFYLPLLLFYVRRAGLSFFLMLMYFTIKTLICGKMRN